MRRESFFGEHQKYVVGLLPVFGVALTSVHQMGQFSFYNVPYQLMEFSTVNTLISAIALTVTSAAALLSLVIAYDGDLRTWWQRVIQHVALAGMLTGPFWLKSLNLGAGLSWPTIAFIALLAAAGFLAESYYRGVKSGSDATLDLKKRAELALHVVMVLGLVGLIGSFAHGHFHAKERALRLFIQGTNDLVVGSFGGRLVVKRYDPATAEIERKTTIVLEPPPYLVIEERDALIGGAER